ncbi:hypothetical protein RchiOBHm_Chr5g0065011 [Rosa chinensis]|uniref:Uncharacterized protein n=1 Tax=Rosa chinensis TaxID=74649 RepID=A0A2P6QIT7_ROSCH|nr:hypothetical protein RchiOBHm_Chr5g0065011 [Rosa chinensis]
MSFKRLSMLRQSWGSYWLCLISCQLHRVLGDILYTCSFLFSQVFISSIYNICFSSNLYNSTIFFLGFNLVSG